MNRKRARATHGPARTQRLVVGLGLGLTACGPGDPRASGEETGTPDPNDTGPPELVSTHHPDSCDGVNAVLPLAGGGFVVVGDSAVIAGWIARFDDALTPIWEAGAAITYADVALGPDETLWVAGGSWGQPAAVHRYGLDGEPLAGLSEFTTPALVEPQAIARAGQRMIVGGRVGDQLPFDAWLVELDEQGATLVTHDAPTGDGNVSATIRAIEAGPELATACGTAGGGEWGWPWILLLSGTDATELSGETPALGVRACVDVAVSASEIAWAETGDPNALVVVDTLGIERWRIELDDPLRALAFGPNDVLLAASNTALAGFSSVGEALWSVAFDVDGLSVRDLAVLADGSILVAGDTPGAVGECSDAWLALFR